jgi:hypothetical protein
MVATAADDRSPRLYLASPLASLIIAFVEAGGCSMPFFSSDDQATRIGEAIGSIFATFIYIGVVVLIIVQFFQH